MKRLLFFTPSRGKVAKKSSGLTTTPVQTLTKTAGTVDGFEACRAWLDEQYVSMYRYVPDRYEPGFWRLERYVVPNTYQYGFAKNTRCLWFTARARNGNR